MFEKLKKHAGKIFVFFINFLLMAIAVLVIREKDQARLLEKAQEEKENLEKENTKINLPASFENSVSIEEQGGANESENAPAPTDIPDQILPSNTVVSPPAPVPAVSVPATSAPAPATKAKPANRTTKTS